MNARKWRVHIETKADKQLKKLSPKDQARVLLSIEELAQSDNPTFTLGVKYVQNSKSPKIWRQRQGNWRIFFEIQPGVVVKADVEYKGILVVHSIDIHHIGY